MPVSAKRETCPWLLRLPSCQFARLLETAELTLVSRPRNRFQQLSTHWLWPTRTKEWRSILVLFESMTLHQLMDRSVIADQVCWAARRGVVNFARVDA